MRALAWQAFLADVAAQHAWLVGEAKAAGFDVTVGGANLAKYVARTGQEPSAFVASLFRPTDVDDVFPDTPADESREARVRRAFESWRRRKA